MFFTLVVTLGPVLFFRPEPAPNRRNLPAAEARTEVRFAGYSAPDLANLSARRVYLVVPAWRCFLFFTTVILRTGPHPNTASSFSPLSSSRNSRKARLASARAIARMSGILLSAHIPKPSENIFLLAAGRSNRGNSLQRRSRFDR